MKYIYFFYGILIYFIIFLVVTLTAAAFSYYLVPLIGGY